MLPLVIGIGLAIFLIVFFFYSSLTIKHAARFRYLSRRTVYLTVFFVGMSAALMTLIAVSYLWMLLN